MIRLQCLAQFWDFTLTPSCVLSWHRASLVQADMVPACYHELTVGGSWTGHAELNVCLENVVNPPKERTAGVLMALGEAC